MENKTENFMELLKTSDFVSKDVLYYNIVKYHDSIRRSFKIKESCKIKYYIKCDVELCTFKANFFCATDIWKNTVFNQHSCPPCLSNLNMKRMKSAKYIAFEPTIKNMLTVGAKKIKPSSLVDHLGSKGIKISVQNSSRLLNKIKEKNNKSTENQFSQLESFVHLMNLKGSPSYLEKDIDGRFIRMMVIFRDGIDQFDRFYMKGIQFDCTFCKTKIGGTLMLACFKDGNNNIRIIASALVESENEISWKWFMTNLKANLTVIPSFIMSDREKGLIKAAMIFDNVPHFYCFRHVMVNLCSKFKAFRHRKQAWDLVKSESHDLFKKTASYFNKTPEIYEWLNNIGFDKLSIAHSPVPRYNIVTSNNVESLNARIKNIRGMDSLDLFMELERTVISDRSASYEASKSSEYITTFAKKLLDNQLELSLRSLVRKIDDHYYIVTSDIERRVFIGNSTSCTCGYYNNMRIPCSHIIAVFKSINQDFMSLCCNSWKTSIHLDAYCNRYINNGPTIVPDLEYSVLLPPIYSVKRGRPRKSRIESQFSLLHKKKK